VVDASSLSYFPQYHYSYHSWDLFESFPVALTPKLVQCISVDPKVDHTVVVVSFDAVHSFHTFIGKKYFEERRMLEKEFF
jgi:hypothetical protein